MIDPELEQRVTATEKTFLAWIEANHRRMTPDRRVGESLAADLIGVSCKSLRNMRSQGLGPAFHKTGRISYRIKDLARWIERSRQATLQSLEI